MRLPDQVLNTVCFIAKSAAKDTYRATGFLVSVAGAQGNAHLYLVTAKHVARAVAAEPFIIGFNSTQGTKGRFEVNYDPAYPHRWWDHPTEPNAVDAAVFPFAPTEYHLLDVEWIHYPNMFATPEIIASEGIGIGDEIAVIGLFTGFSGEKKHFPIARIGNLAMLPNERIPLERFDPMEAYLAEGRSIGGLSGSPVFGTCPGVSRRLQTQRLSTWGISIIVPAQKVWEVVNHPELAEQRRLADEIVAKEKAS